MKLLKLTRYYKEDREEEQPVYVNFDLVTVFDQRRNHTMIYFASDSEDYVAVIEPPDQILTMLKNL